MTSGTFFVMIYLKLKTTTKHYLEVENITDLSSISSEVRNLTFWGVDFKVIIEEHYDDCRYEGSEFVFVNISKPKWEKRK